MDSKFEEQKKLASIIKNIHQDLRESCREVGTAEAWKKHLKNKDKLKLYADSMKELSEKHWKERNSSSDDRIAWVIKSCDEYFTHQIDEHRRKELEIMEKLKSEGFDINVDEKSEININEKLKVIDVGSSGNFFQHHKRFDLLAIDIAPSSEEVLYCDFLSVSLSSELVKDTEKVISLPTNHFDIVIFCLLLEYLPASELRIKCCEKAYEILKKEGILCIITPDSNYQHKNAQQLKIWKYTLANMGFKRIKIEKLTNLSCMVFRKALSKEITRRWIGLRKEPHVEFRMDIPQDRNINIHEKGVRTDCNFDADIMHELPFE